MSDKAELPAEIREAISVLICAASENGWCTHEQEDLERAIHAEFRSQSERIAALERLHEDCREWFNWFVTEPEPRRARAPRRSAVDLLAALRSEGDSQ